jgi:hypothetical protein
MVVQIGWQPKQADDSFFKGQVNTYCIITALLLHYYCIITALLLHY